MGSGGWHLVAWELLRPVHAGCLTCEALALAIIILPRAFAAALLESSSLAFNLWFL